MKAPFIALVLLFISLIGGAASAQTAPTASQTPDPSISANQAIGEVKVIDTANKQLIIKTDAAALVTVKVSETTSFVRVPPGATNLANATKITSTDVAEGDRILALGRVAEDRKSVPARAVVVMTKEDIAKKQEAERAEWKRRGVLGIISALKPDSKEITITRRTVAGPETLIIPVSDKVQMRRYAPDSIKFADAKPSTFEELKVGDQLRALGEKDPAGTKFNAEKVVTGSFKTVGGVVTSVNAATGEIKINDLQTKQPLTIVVKQDAVLRKFPSASEMGGGMVMMRPGGGGGGQGPGGGAPGQGGGGPRPGGGGGMNIQDMLERLPTIALADVKTGDTIIVSSTKGADPSRLTAISLISNADTLLNMVAARQQAAGQSAPNPSAGLGSGIQFGIGLP
jgi:hypothetical protein